MVSMADRLVPHLYRLAQGDPEHAGKVLAQLIIQRQADFSEGCKLKGGRGKWPGLDMVGVSAGILKITQVLSFDSSHQSEQCHWLII